MTEIIQPMAAQIDQQQLAQELVEQARAEGVELVGQGGLLTRLTKSVLETALEAEMTEHVGYDKHDPMGRNGGNSRNGTRTKTVFTEIGPVDIEVPGGLGRFVLGHRAFWCAPPPGRPPAAKRGPDRPGDQRRRPKAALDPRRETSHARRSQTRNSH